MLAQRVEEGVLAPRPIPPMLRCFSAWPAVMGALDDRSFQATAFGNLVDLFLVHGKRLQECARHMAPYGRARAVADAQGHPDDRMGYGKSLAWPVKHLAQSIFRTGRQSQTTPVLFHCRHSSRPCQRSSSSHSAETGTGPTSTGGLRSGSAPASGGASGDCWLHHRSSDLGLPGRPAYQHALPSVCRQDHHSRASAGLCGWQQTIAGGRSVKLDAPCVGCCRCIPYRHSKSRSCQRPAKSRLRFPK